MLTDWKCRLEMPRFNIPPIEGPWTCDLCREELESFDAMHESTDRMYEQMHRSFASSTRWGD